MYHYFFFQLNITLEADTTSHKTAQNLEKNVNGTDVVVDVNGTKLDNSSKVERAVKEGEEIVFDEIPVDLQYVQKIFRSFL